MAINVLLEFMTKIKVCGFITKMENEIIIGGELKMKLSKIVKKITSISLAATLAVSGINYQPAKAEAAALPVVTVLGATLSLDADAGKQSMRVAIQVENADNASACGMSITYNGKKLDFSTEDAKYNKLYDYDEKTKKVVYAVKIANIPSDNFDDNFIIEGYATPITGAEEGEKVTTETPVEKSVDSVVAGIAEKLNDNSVKLLDGKLVKYSEGFNVDLSKIAEDQAVDYDGETNSLKGTSVANFMVPLGKTFTSGYVVKANIVGSKKGDILRSYLTGGVDVSQTNVVAVNNQSDTLMPLDLDLEYVVNENASATHMMIKCGAAGAGTNWDEVEITSITIECYYKLMTANDIGDTNIDKSINIDLASIETKKGSGDYDENLKQYIMNDASGDSEAHMALPETLAAGKSLKIRVKGNWKGTTGFRFWIGDGPNNNGDHVQVFKGFTGAFDETFVITASVDCSHLTIKHINPWDGGGAIDGLEIDSISVEYVR